jgi:Cu-Zn family superoxide dismutase
MGISGMLLLGGRVLQSQETSPTEPSKKSHQKAVAELSATQGNKVKGKIVFIQEDAGVHVMADVTGLAPGEHGFHIHEKGDCSSPDGKSAGDHFNPTGMPHAGPTDVKRHVGDLGNLTADASGKAQYDRVDAQLAFEGTNSILGRAVIVHATKDDLSSQPAGNAGARIACGVIELER